jgi:putative chitinase
MTPKKQTDGTDSQILKQIMPQARKSKLEEFLIYLREYYKFAGLDTAKRMSSFLSQLGHESLEFLYMEEIASGKAYEGRKIWVMFASETANVSKDVVIQLTGRKNYEKFTLWVLKNQKAIWEFPPKSIPNFVENQT